VARQSGGQWLRAHLGFAGPFQGELTVDLPEPLAKSLLASCLGLDASDDSQFSAVVIEDGAGELANMICGTWPTRSYGNLRFDLMPPRVERLAQTAATATSAATPGKGVLLTGINDLPVRVGLSVQES
jgi:CheY-specific phosphatase CheX